MKSIICAGAVVLGLLSSPAWAGAVFVHHGYVHRAYVGHCYPRYHYGHGFAFSFGYVAPAPVYIAPPPVVYYPPPPVVVAPPVVVPPPVVAQPAPEAAQPEAEPAQPAPEYRQAPPPPPPQPRFIETGRRFHGHGDNAGRLDWVEGLMDGRPIRIYYDDFGRVSKQKWID